MPKEGKSLISQTQTGSQELCETTGRHTSCNRCHRTCRSERPAHVNSIRAAMGTCQQDMATTFLSGNPGNMAARFTPRDGLTCGGASRLTCLPREVVAAIAGGAVVHHLEIFSGEASNMFVVAVLP